MTCKSTCIKPSPSQAHCAVCHITWSGVGGFDAHRRAGTCRTPAELGYRADGRGVYSKPVTEAERERLAALRDRDGYAPSGHRVPPLGAETGSVVGRDTPGDLDAAETLSGGSA